MVLLVYLVTYTIVKRFRFFCNISYSDDRFEEFNILRNDHSTVCGQSQVPKRKPLLVIYHNLIHHSFNKEKVKS